MTYWVAGAAAVGAMADRKNPLRGAALGAGAMMTGGAALGAGGATAAAAGSTGAAAAGGTAAAGGVGGAAGSGLLAEGAAGAGSAAGGTAAASGATAAGGGASASAGTGGLLNSYVKPIGTAAMSANAVRGLLTPTPNQPIQASPISPTPNTGPGGLTELVQANNMAAQNIQNDAAVRMQKRAGLISRMGGNYGPT